jgi:hypothetical protein
MEQNPGPFGTVSGDRAGRWIPSAPTQVTRGTLTAHIRTEITFLIPQLVVLMLVPPVDALNSTARHAIQTDTESYL